MFYLKIFDFSEISAKYRFNATILIGDFENSPRLLCWLKVYCMTRIVTTQQAKPLTLELGIREMKKNLEF